MSSALASFVFDAAATAPRARRNFHVQAPGADRRAAARIRLPAERSAELPAMTTAIPD